MLGYSCATQPLLKFTKAALGSEEAALLACNNACSASRFKDCTTNAPLLTVNRTVSAPTAPAASWPFTDINAYSSTLSKVYPTPAPNSNTPPAQDPRDYYKPLLPYPTDAGGKALDCLGADSGTAACKTYLANQAIRGPAGAKVFECSSNGDCLSGVCDTSSYLRGGCFLKNGQSVDCGCRYVADCKHEYPCEALPAGGSPRYVCESNRARCEAAFGGQDKLDGQVVTVCDYRPTTSNVFGVQLGLKASNSPGRTDAGEYAYCNNFWGSTVDFTVGSIDRFACSPYDKYNEPPVEFANRQVYSDTNALVCADGSDLVCKNGYAWSQQCSAYSWGEHSVWIGPDCSNDDCSHEDKNFWTLKGNPREGAACLSGATPVKGSGWTPNTGWTVDLVRWTPFYELYTVPDRPVVGGPYPVGQYADSGGQLKAVKGVIYTSSNVNFCSNDAGRSLSGLGGSCDETKPESCTCSGPLSGLAWNDVKLKLIQACHLQYGKDIVLFRPDNANSNTPVGSPAWQQYVEKTWLILGYGDCQTNLQDEPVVVSYGICRPCSTSLTLASQGVSHTAAYCPAGCRSSRSYDNVGLCDCKNNQFNLPAVAFPASAGPDTNPDFGFLVGKVDEFQKAAVLPLLDLRAYPMPAQPPDIRFQLTDDNCAYWGAVTEKSDVVQDPNGGYTSVYFCRSSSYSNLLLTYLSGNHSAVILDAAALPAAADQPAQDAARKKVTQIRQLCPDCLTALEYQTPIDLPSLAAAPAGYPLELNASIEAYSGGVKFDPLRMEPPAWPDPAGEKAVSDVSMLVLDVDLSGASSNPDALAGQIDLLVNLSRRTLQHVGWPTILRLTYTRGAAGALTSEAVYKALYDRQADLTLAGVGGILLPPLDNANHDTVGQAYSDPSNAGRLLDLGGSRSEVNTAGTTFCAAQNGSTEYLHPKIMVGLQKIYTTPNCGCSPCTALEIAAGECNPLCYDGQPGHDIASYKGPKKISDAIADGDVPTCSAAGKKCEPFCINAASCNVVNSSAWAAKTTTCTALRSTNEPPVPCCSGSGCVSKTNPSLNTPIGSHFWPDCDIQANISLGQLADSTIHPDASYLLAGLPHSPQVFCLQSPSNDPNTPRAKFTFRSLASVEMSPEPVLFPKYGSNTSDCGRTNVPGIDATQVACGTPLPPVLDTLWSCTQPA
ncbi:Uncharacterised protein [uncultured archaeon]|nr:Uncharacterised protein [uncultured archaeon]